MLPKPGIAAPAGHRLLEVADHREAERRQPGRHVVEQVEEPQRQVHQRRVHRRIRRAASERPVAARVLGHPVEHRAGRSETERGQHDEPEEHTEHMAVRGQQRVLDDVAQQFGARQFARVQMAPLRQQPACLGLVGAVERVADVGEIVAELSESERDVEDRDIPGQRQQQAEVGDAGVNAPGDQRRQDRGDGPDDPGMVIVAGVEVAAGPAQPVGEAVVHDVAARQRLQLLDQQREQDGEKTHVRPMIPTELRGSKARLRSAIAPAADAATAVQRCVAAPQGGQKSVQVPEHRRGRAPDEVAPCPTVRVDGFPWNGQKLAPSPADLDRMAPMVRRVHQERERHFEDLGDFEGFGLDAEAGPHERDDRRDDEAGAGGVGRHCAEHVDVSGFQADLFTRLAQRGGSGGRHRSTRPGHRES